MNTSIKTTCPYCGVGCGVIVTKEQQQFAVKGDSEHPANYGRLCSKGSALAETLGLDGRLLDPEIQGRQVSWDMALDTVAKRFQQIIQQHGKEAVAFYVSGQLLTEDYYMANKLMKGFIGTANIDTNSRLCMSSSVAAYKRAFGADSVPGCYEDLEQADLVVLVGSNTAWCHPVLYQRLKKTKQQRPELKIIVIDPRKTATCEIADLHLPLKSGSDAFLFNGLLNHLHQQDALDWAFIDQHTEHFTSAMAKAKQTAPSIPALATITGLIEVQITQFYQSFASTPKTVTLYSQGINQSSSGTDKCNAIINCHLATGRIGQVGMGPFSITGQPNAMGGREVGGLANMLAAHLDFLPEHLALVQRFWQSPVIANQAGLKAVDLFKAISAGKIKAVWIMATNPAVSMPDANQIRKALAECELVVVSDCIKNTDTTQYADVLLPAATWAEKDGTVTNSERRISRQRPFLELPGAARPDWWIICQVAQRMGFAESFNYQSAADIFREHAALSGFENNGSRDFDISPLSELTDEEYQTLPPLQWPVVSKTQGSQRLFTDKHFFTASGKAQFVAITPQAPVNTTNETYPFILNTGRLRDQWHTMTRTGKTARLMEHAPEPCVSVNGEDIKRLNLLNGSLIKVTSRWGSLLARLQSSDEIQPGNVFIPMHWNDQFAPHACVGRLVNSVTDPISGQPELKHTPVRLEAYQPQWYAFVLSRIELNFKQQDYWVKARGRQFMRYELASEKSVMNWQQWASEFLGNAGEWLEFSDAATGRYRAALVKQQRLEAVLFAAKSFDLPTRTWLSQLFNKAELDDTDRMSLLAGKPAQGIDDMGETVCACFGIGVNTILKAITEQKLLSVEMIGQALKAGTNCGSCVPEIKKLLNQSIN